MIKRFKVGETILLLRIRLFLLGDLFLLGLLSASLTEHVYLCTSFVHLLKTMSVKILKDSGDKDFPRVSSSDLKQVFPVLCEVWKKKNGSYGVKEFLEVGPESCRLMSWKSI